MSVHYKLYRITVDSGNPRTVPVANEIVGADQAVVVAWVTAYVSYINLRRVISAAPDKKQRAIAAKNYRVSISKLAELAGDSRRYWTKRMSAVAYEYAVEQLSVVSDDKVRQ